MSDLDSPNTVAEAVDALRREGYTADFELVDGELHSDGGNAPCPIEDVIVDRFYRFEGPSDPGDEMIVFALRDSRTGARGSLAAAYGPAADPALTAHLGTLRRRAT